MLKHYIGSWHRLDEPDETLVLLLENGERVMWRKCWREQYGRLRPDLDGRWQALRSLEDLDRASFNMRTETVDVGDHRFFTDLESYCEVSWRISDERYPLIQARDNQRKRMLDESVRARANDDQFWINRGWWVMCGSPAWIEEQTGSRI